MNNELMKSCPFCGCDAVVKWEKDTMISVGCGEPSMLCPNPSMVLYKQDDGSYDYQYWNNRA